MKIDNTKSSGTFTQPPQKAQETESKATSAKQNTHSLPITHTISTDNIKDSNTNIGKLQTLQASLDSIEQKVRNLQKISDETQREQKAQEVKDEITQMMQTTKFQGQKVFGVNIRDSQGNIVLQKVSLDTSLISEDTHDLDAFNQELKDLRKDIKEAIALIAEDAQANAQKIHTQAKATKEHKESTLDSITEEKQPSKIASFFKGMGDLLRGSHDTNKLDSKRVSKLLS